MGWTGAISSNWFNRLIFNLLGVFFKKNKPPQINGLDSEGRKLSPKIAVLSPGNFVFGTEIEYNM
jgi:hypothetical protein